ncbi:MAG: class I SAM-dependent rRNA methyltransferase [Candidatus Omnitrophica bacterium]|nr:class I SAM-dependent rRNA methyltransferase [Candidatus Omnitrophota bacterium]
MRNEKAATVKGVLSDPALLLKRAFLYRGTLKLDTNAMRLVNSRRDGLEGLIIDRFNKHFVVYVLDAGWHPHQRAITDTLAKHFEVEYLVFKDRTVSQTRSASHIAVDVLIGQGNSKTIVEENGLRFHVDLNDHLNQGLFLDMRKNRKLLSAYALGRSVLNCFAYTCSFGVYCRKYGVSRLTNVDISAKFLQKGKENYRLNHLHEGRSEFVQENASLYLDRVSKRNNFFDIIILDPPSFSQFNKTVFSVKKDMPLLIEKAFRALTPEGMLFVSTNLSSISRQQLEEWARQAALKTGREIMDVDHLGQDVEFCGFGLMKESFLSAVLIKTRLIHT